MKWPEKHISQQIKLRVRNIRGISGEQTAIAIAFAATNK